MYSIVLLAALTAGGETTHFNSSCYGCCGYYGWACWGCHGGGWGCSGGGYGCGAGYGCGGQGWYGVWGGSGCSGVVVFSACCGIIVPHQHHNQHLFDYHHYAHPLPTPMPEVKPEDKPNDPDKKPVDDKALLNVEVDADARLYINERLMKTASARRSFDTPRLEKGKTYRYTLCAEVVRDGKTVTRSKDVIVKAGETVGVSFVNQVATKAERGRLVVDVSADAKLYINGRLMKTTSARRTFDTPAMEKGKTFHYTLRAEALRDGKIVSETREVAVKAGEEMRTSLLTSAVSAVAVSQP